MKESTNPRIARMSGLVSRSVSPYEFESQLQIAWLAETESWSAAAVSCIADQAEAARVERHGGISVVSPVEDIEDLDAELGFQALFDGELFEHRRIDDEEARPVDCVAAEIPGRARGRRPKCAAIDPGAAGGVGSGREIGEWIPRQVDADVGVA